MVKKRKNTHGFAFENKIDFENWNFNSIDNEFDDAVRSFEVSMEYSASSCMADFSSFAIFGLNPSMKSSYE
mgnify:CR=1 FL=1